MNQPSYICDPLCRLAEIEAGIHPVDEARKKRVWDRIEGAMDDNENNTLHMKSSNLMLLVLWCGIAVISISCTGFILTHWWPFIVTEIAGIGLAIFAAVNANKE